MSTNHFFKDLYFDRWGDPKNPNAVEPCSTADKDRVATHGILDRLRHIFRRSRKRPSAWSFTIPSETSLAESDADVGHCNPCDAAQPKFLAIAKALSRNC
ncbi:hypothetical protein A6U86_20795 [Rhizobium sp. AC27/96]|nr:hypothetical protein A6U86_20795 [Rhizobium sp. AC27/96]